MPTNSCWSIPGARHRRRSTTRPSGWAARRQFGPRDVVRRPKATGPVGRVGQTPPSFGAGRGCPPATRTPVPGVSPPSVRRACPRAVSAISPTCLSSGISGYPLRTRARENDDENAPIIYDDGGTQKNNGKTKQKKRYTVKDDRWKTCRRRRSKRAREMVDRKTVRRFANENGLEKRREIARRPVFEFSK